MPVSPVIAGAAGEFAHNNGFLQKVVGDLTADEWLARPSDRSNPIAWLVGHTIWARQALITGLGGKWNCPGLEPFARSAKPDAVASYPTPEALLALWEESAAALDATLNALTEEALAAPPPPGPPSPDGKTSGFIGLMAWHDTYHIGQIAYLRGWLGHTGIYG
jgi:uncharacterized damage-inducible protein DinB